MLSAFFLAMFFLPALGLWPLALGLTALGLHEFHCLVRKSGLEMYSWTAQGSGAVLISAIFLSTPGSGVRLDLAGLPADQWILLAILFAVTMRGLAGSDPRTALVAIAVTLLGIGYVAYLFGYFLRLSFWADEMQWLAPLPTTGRRLILYAIVVVKCSDIGAYAVGRLIGRHKLFPSLSPKKTWEGLAGGLMAGVGTSLAFNLLGQGRLGAVPLGWRHAITLALALCLFGVAGDLFASRIKRAAQVKDSGVIPGNGGMLDVFDSLLFSIPVMAVYTGWWLSGMVECA